MKIFDAEIAGVKVIEPNVFGDDRGWFMESYRTDILEKNGININFMQDNHSYSKERNTLRGLHFQLGPHAQTKLVRCLRGAIFDVVVDLREDSKTFSKWLGFNLNSDNKKQLLVPKGMAHGFLTLTADAEVAYKVDAPYVSESDSGIRWDDPDIGIEWNLAGDTPILSEKDSKALYLKDMLGKFKFV